MCRATLLRFKLQSAVDGMAVPHTTVVTEGQKSKLERSCRILLQEVEARVALTWNAAMLLDKWNDFVARLNVPWTITGLNSACKR